jgi:hypothetical protein
VERAPVCDRWFFVVAAAIIGLVVAHLFILDRPVKIDDGGLINPILEYVHTGRVVYPAHGSDHAESMIIHPPVHYWLAGVLVKLGWNLYPALVTLPFIMAVVALVAITLAPFTSGVKVALAFGLLVPNFILIDLDPIRPELQMALAWLAALVLLESGRRREWSAPQLFAGSFLLAYAAGLHYFAYPAILGLAVYTWLAIHDLEWRSAGRAITWIAAGAALFVVPYCLLFLVPEAKNIAALVTALRAVVTTGGDDQSRFAAFQLHRESYPSAYVFMLESSQRYRSIFAYPFKPVLMNAIPAVMLSVPLLLIEPQTRTMALASLGFQLPLLLLFRHKSLPYYRAEFALLTAAFIVVAIRAAEMVTARLGGRPSWVAPLASVLLATAAVADSRIWSIPAGGVFVDEIAVARAAGKAVIGNDALVAGRSVCLWYTSGARYYRNVTGDLLYPRDISRVVPSRYFVPFDAVAEDAQGSSVTYNLQRKSLPSWYMDGTLQLLGLYAGRNPRGDNAGYFLSGVRSRGPVLAFYWCGDRLCRFTERVDGDAVLLAVASAVPVRAANRWTPLLTFALAPDGAQSLRFYIASAETAALPVEGFVRDRIVGTVTPEDVRVLLERVDYRVDWSDIFYTPEEMAAPYAIARGGRIPFSFSSSSAAGKAVADPAPRLNVERVQSAALLSSDPVPIEHSGEYLVGFDLEVRHGAVVVSVVDAAGKTLFQVSRTHSHPFVSIKIVESVEQPTAVRLMVWSNNEMPSRTSIGIRNAFVQRVDLPSQFRVD